LHRTSVSNTVYIGMYYWCAKIVNLYPEP
jgi:hypothetical protein